MSPNADIRHASSTNINRAWLSGLRQPRVNRLAIVAPAQQIPAKPPRTWSTGMKAVGYKKSLPVDAADSLIDFETAKPEPKGRDLRVAVKAISANPVDYKVRKRAAPPEGETKILGYDAAGIVDAVGPDVTLFKPGDEVFYAGSIQRQGTNSEFHLVDERIVGAKPKTLSLAQAAALPLTSITAWELLFDRLSVVPGKSVDPRTLLIVGGAGGVGSILIQLGRRLTGLTVVATASRPESRQWCLDLGAHAVIDHSKPMKEQIDKLKLPPVGLIASLTNTGEHYKALADVIAPQGKYGLIDDPQEFNVSVFKGKAVSVHWESMFTRSSFQTPDMIAQHNLLNDVADLIDKGVLRTTVDQTFGTINAANLKRAHALLESGKSRGKIVLEGW
jgi:zinc-binding alcohol dehydrogenase family protein